MQAGSLASSTHNSVTCYPRPLLSRGSGRANQQL